MSLSETSLKRQMWRGGGWGVHTQTIRYTATDEEKKWSQRTLMSAVLSKTQLDFTQLNRPIFKKARFSPKRQ